MIAQRLVRTDGCFLWSGVGDRLRSFGSQKKVIPQDDNDSFRFLGSEDRGAGGARGHGGSVLFGDVFDLLKDVLQVGAREEAAVEDDAADFLRVANVVEGIGVQEHEVGNLALFDGAELILHGEEMRRMERGRLKSFERSKARGDRTAGNHKKQAPAVEKRRDSAESVADVAIESAGFWIARGQLRVSKRAEKREKAADNPHEHRDAN